MPAARAGALPLGLSLVGGRWDDGRLLDVSDAVERVLHARVPPVLPPVGVPG